MNKIAKNVGAENETDVVGVGVLRATPNIKLKYTNKLTSNIQRPTSNAAITLIALIITIIVLLILAGVTLNMVMGENGIIKKAQLAKVETKNVQDNENRQITELENYIDTLNTTSRFDDSRLYCMSVNVSDDGSQKQYDLPDGFTSENCMIVGYQGYHQYHNTYYSNYNYLDELVVQMNKDNKIIVSAGSQWYRKSNVKILLYRFN